MLAYGCKKILIAVLIAAVIIGIITVAFLMSSEQPQLPKENFNEGYNLPVEVELE